MDLLIGPQEGPILPEWGASKNLSSKEEITNKKGFGLKIGRKNKG